MKSLVNKALGKLGYRISRKKTKGDLILEAQRKLIKDGQKKVIFDVGAFVGETVIDYHQLFDGHCEIYAFEPFEQSYQQLLAKTHAHSNIHAFNIALGHQRSEVHLHVNSYSATNSLLETDPEGFKSWGTGLLETQNRISVPMETIDHLVQAHHIDQINILKLDTQGSEYLVLEGAQKTIAEKRVQLILAELTVMPTYKDQQTLDEMLRMYREYGFELYNLYNSSSPNGQLRYMDGIFVRKDLLP